MKKLLMAAIAALLFLQPAMAQKTVKKPLSSASGKQQVNIQMERSTLQISGYAGSEVVIETDDEFKGPPERAKGLKPLYNNATDNTGIGLDVQEAGGVMTIKKASSTSATYKIKVPAGANVRIEEQGWENGDISAKDISGEIEIVGSGAGIKLENITGPVVANSISGNIEIVFSRLNQEKPTHINAISGFIDVTLAADTKASLNLVSMSGECYTDFDVATPEDDKAKGLKPMKRNGSGNINGGGVELTLNAISGNVYLRKK